MKTCEQHSKEIFCEIKRRKTANAALKKRAVKAFAFTLLIGLLLPATVYFSATATNDNNQPLSFDLSSENAEDKNESEIIAPRETRHDIVLAF